MWSILRCDSSDGLEELTVDIKLPARGCNCIHITKREKKEGERLTAMRLPPGQSNRDSDHQESNHPRAPPTSAMSHPITARDVDS